MRRFLQISFWVALASFPANAEEAKTETLTFYISGVECPACVYSVNDAIRRLEGVVEVSEGQANEHFSNVTFEPGKVTAQQVAQAVREAFPLHGAPYLATLKIRLPEYSKGENAARVGKLFVKWKDRVTVEIVNAESGNLVIHFLPMESETEKPGPQGWKHEDLLAALRQPSPGGLGLKVEMVEERF